MFRLILTTISLDTLKARIQHRSEPAAQLEARKPTHMAPDAQVSDLFGWSVAISGDTALIGASYEDDVAANAGKVYIF